MASAAVHCVGVSTAGAGAVSAAAAALRVGGQPLGISPNACTLPVSFEASRLAPPIPKFWLGPNVRPPSTERDMIPASFTRALWSFHCAWATASVVFFSVTTMEGLQMMVGALLSPPPLPEQSTRSLMFRSWICAACAAPSSRSRPSSVVAAAPRI